ncbi:hypothetical protein [Endozoicomonas sp. SCSIO W0465]|uniref:hypothetical protein n=1 Tax=Endozoicomonas sp. SCSIO W0465 TaxID=2918516 RepID=UPI002075AA31|nr:hypothetical protein [Endozoicomonas sp. SCSIO W0465]USE38379.1 hypothetical protein MJO57_09540 [Endozoicomonas sp. SCSIO W0465]
MESLQRRIPQQKSPDVSKNARSRKKAGKSLPTVKGSSTSFRARGEVSLYDDAPRLSSILVPCARLGSRATDLLGRAISVITPALTMSIAHSILFDEQAGNVPAPSVMDYNCAHIVLGGAFMAGLSLSSRLGKSLQETSHALSDYATHCTEWRYTNPPHTIKVELRGIKKLVENFLRKNLNELFRDAILSVTRKSFTPLNERLNSEDGTSVNYKVLQEINESCQERVANEFKGERFQRAFKKIESAFLALYQPPGGHYYLDFVDNLPGKSKTGFVNAIKREKISLEALANYQYFFIRKVYGENRDTIIQSIKTNADIQLKKVTKEQFFKYEAKITSYLSMQASKRLTSQSDLSPLLPGLADEHGGIVKAAQKPVSLQQRAEKIVAFEKACYKLSSARINFKEFKVLQKTVNAVLEDPHLKESAIKLHGYAMVKEATILSEQYTLYDGKQG